MLEPVLPAPLAGMARGWPFPHILSMWYERHHRHLPWRETQDPYRIWVSETMLQQTRVETVIPYYRAFLERFPDIRALAAASEEEVLKLWQGLGYYSRARNLRRAAKQVAERYGGRIPEQVELFRALPGVGPYTAGAVFSIAFNQPVPAVDGNVLRVWARLHNLHQPVDLPEVRRAIERQVGAWLQEAQPAVLTQALMELGAVVCTPRSPRCAECPVREGCAAHRAGTAETLPKRAPKRPRRKVTVLALWCETEAGVVVEQRPRDGLLGGLWQLPAVELDEEEGLADRSIPREALTRRLHDVFPDADGMSPTFVELAQERHVFTHLEWSVRLFRPVAGLPSAAAADPERYRVVRREALGDLPWPRVYEKLVLRALNTTLS
ncbi:A/G-specific adenine glycosylase [Alicyclobacillus macrosporangiidus]|uniref:A/G-specific adenine glycosylase n=1 Tax=Alicyclobacillus macrosporangiidus TaxID=392015 RepID=UPI000AC9A9A2|nr:A/G-specific adenine glycosylase [Alicyclobacillus macrosporangiidus]